MKYLRALVAMALAFVVSVIAFASPAQATTYSPTKYNCWHTGSDIMLTFDDTISNARLDVLLPLLQRENVKATFFLNTSNTPPSVYKRIRAAGHIVANHTYSHPNLTTLPDASIRSQVSRGRTTYTNSPLVRPPYGATNSRVDNVIRSMSYKTCIWTFDSRDWDNRTTASATTLVNRVKNGGSLYGYVRPNGVMLFHGTGRYTIAAMPSIINTVQAKGYTFTRLR